MAFTTEDKLEKVKRELGRTRKPARGKGRKSLPKRTLQEDLPQTSFQRKEKNGINIQKVDMNMKGNRDQRVTAVRITGGSKKKLRATPSRGRSGKEGGNGRAPKKKNIRLKCKKEGG